MKKPTLKHLTSFTLESYVQLLKYLKQKYKIVPVCKLSRKDTPHLILRHDIDYSLPASLKMAQIEKDLNIKSTYFVMLSSGLYNLLSENNIDIIQQISKLGHEIGLHYYPTQYRLYNRNPMKTLEIEIELLEHLLGKKIYSIARHGHWDKDPFAGIKKYINANHPYFRGNLFVHESGRAWTPLQGLARLLNDPPKRVQLLIHAGNWQEDKIDRVALLERYCQDFKNKISWSKRRFLEYFQTDQLIIDYDNAVKRGFNHLNCQGTGKCQVKQNWVRLLRYYLIYTSVGWKLHQLKTRLENVF